MKAAKRELQMLKYEFVLQRLRQLAKSGAVTPEIEQRLLCTMAEVRRKELLGEDVEERMQLIALLLEVTLGRQEKPQKGVRA